MNETGFASDLGLEKYMDLVSPLSGIQPAVAVLVTTVQSLKQQGEGDLEGGFANLDKHISHRPRLWTAGGRGHQPLPQRYGGGA